MNLFIDTHLNDVAIVLHKDDSIIKVRVLKGVTENSKVIMPTIKKILNRQTPESVIVVNGPGSFTGVRLGVTIGKTLANTLEIPIRVINTLECMAISLNDDIKERVVSFSDNNGYYMGFFDSNNKKHGEYQYVTKEEYNEFANRYDVYEDVKIDYLKVINVVLQRKPVSAHDVKAEYIKKIDVEKNDKER